MSIRRAILDRRVPQFFALYLGVSWGLVQFVNFLEDRYDLSPHLTDITLLAAGLLIPTILLVTYYHGRPGKDEWSRVEKIGIPLNLLVALVVLFAVFRDKELGATLRSVTTKDEAGQSVTRKVASASYRKRVALFNFAGPENDTSVAWLRYGLPIGVAMDLSQDMFVDVRVSALFREKLRQMGYADDVNVPLTLKRTIANERHLPFFTEAKVSRTGAEITVDFALHESAGGSLVQRRIYKGTDPFALVDEITAGLKRDLQVPENAKVPDLGVSELMTSSLPAFRQFVDGVVAMQQQSQWQQGTEKLEQAVKQDPTFALAWMTLHNTYIYTNQVDRSLPPLQKALDHVYRLPERVQYDVKAEYYLIKQDPERAYQAASTKVALFPDDIAGYDLLIIMQRLRNDRNGMIASLHKILQLDASQQERLRDIAGLQEANGQLDSALHYYAQYTERFPTQVDAFVSVGNLHRRRGDAGAARASFNQALVNRPGTIAALLGLGRLERDLGNFETALKSYEDALTEARTATDSTSALDGLSSYYDFRGQLDRATSYSVRSSDIIARVQPPVVVVQRQLGTAELYARAGKYDAARQIVQRVAKELKPPFNSFAALGEARLLLEMEKPAEAEQALNRVDQAIASAGFQLLRHPAVLSRGRLAELRGNCGEALTRYQEAQKLEPADATIFTAIGRCHRIMQQPALAVENIERTLRMMPANGRANYEIGLAYRDAGNRTKAIEHLQRALLTWENADASHKLARETRAALTQLQAQ